VAFDLTRDPSEQAVSDLFNQFFERECPPATVRGSEPLGFDAGLWEQIRPLGAPGAGVAETLGGGGASMLEMSILAECAGRTLAPIPIVDHVVAARACPEPDLVDGSLVATLALRPASDGIWQLVPAGAIAGVVLGLDGDEFVAVRSAPPGSGPRNHADAPLADRAVTGDRTVVGDRSTFSRCLDEWKLLQAAQLVGLATRALELVIEYVTEREQFGRAVGGFQAVQHGLAECVAPIEGARLLATKAAWAFDEGVEGLDVAHGDVEDPAVLATMAFAFATEVAALVTKRAVQYHGSYGVSVEYDIQLYYRRARGWPLALGNPGNQHDELADLLWPVGS
jgi:alkylation response protein AidB-like acyl-CoA dehydrogenase